MTLQQRMARPLAEVDPEVYRAIQDELHRQDSRLELIASENFTSEAVLEATGSIFTNKYAEGYPGKRYYGGCEFVDIVENLARQRARQLFHAEYANVQPHAGSQANQAAYAAVLQPGDTILGMNLSHGGHLTHGHHLNFSGKTYKVVPYGVRREDEIIDYDELARLGHQVTVYLPFYASVKRHLPADLTYAVRSLTIPFTHYNRFVGIVDGGLRAGVQYYFVDCPELFDRPGLYGTGGGDYPNNWERFGLYCRAVLEASKLLGVPQVFHVHDWQASLIPVYLRTTYNSDPQLGRAGVVLTIHNAGYQGWFPPKTTEQLLFPWSLFTMDQVEHFDSFNFLKGGMVFSDILTTVSRKYALEIQTPEFGERLDSILRGRRSDLRGILNGVDYAQWNPATDAHLAAHYTPSDLAGKRVCRADLLHTFGLEKVGAETPVISACPSSANSRAHRLPRPRLRPVPARRKALMQPARSA